MKTKIIKHRLTGAALYAASVLAVPPEPTRGAATTTLPVYLKWIFDLGITAGFWSILIALTIAGGFFALSAGLPSLRAKAREWLTGAITGFLIFQLMYLILVTIYPALTIFKEIKPQQIPALPSAEEQIHGVYLYEKQSCTGNSYPTVSNIADISGLTKNAVKSVGIVQDLENDIYHIAIVYGVQNYNGQCQYINPLDDCGDVKLTRKTSSGETVQVSPKSASVYTYNENSSGTITFYRNGRFEQAGGYLTLDENDVNGLYEEALANMSFTGTHTGKTSPEDCTVPEKEQDCEKWNASGKCAKRKCPTLAGGNIGSIEINGDFLVVLEYMSKDDLAAAQSGTYVASYCQAYPKDDDINKFGPKQVKWDLINNSPNFWANYVLIVPIKKY